ncbi:hypothetical protein [Ottowia thiooxydans]|uniref:hypothetical protein n=1 Tax=Ottowia thiooxydans TaxID=219182 RepID=UPI0003FAB164|nr:hypothetical protein [Ottowia thiooxydans]
MSDEFAEIERKLKKLLVVPGWSLMRGDEFLPRWQALCGEAGVEVREDLAEDLSDDALVLVMPTDVQLDREQMTALAESGVDVLWVQGSLHAQELPGWRAVCVSGDLLMPELHVSPHTVLQVLGTIECQHLLVYMAEDDEVTREPVLGHVKTPLAIFWFVRCDEPLVLSSDTVIMLMAQWDACEELVHAMPNPMLLWHECIYALRDELYGVPEADSYDEPMWRTDRLTQYKNEGKSIWRDGFDPAALAPWRQGVALQEAAEPEQAWMAHRQAVALAPGFSPALAAMGRILFEQGAVQQALPYLQRAHATFPKQQTAFKDASAYYLSLSLLYQGQADEAREVAQVELNRLNEDMDTERAEMQRVLLEIALVQGRLAEAEQRLQTLQGTNWAEKGSVHWLRGLWNWRLSQRPGEAAQAHLAQAEEAHRTAMGKNEVFDLAYAAHAHLRAVNPAEHQSDWPEREAKALDEAQTVALQAKLVAADPKNIGRVVQAQRTPALLHALVAQCAGSASTWLSAFDEALVQAQVNADVAVQLVRANADVLGHLPAELVTHALCMQAQPWPYAAPDWRRQHFDAEAVPEAVWDEALALLALACGAQTEHLPEAAITPTVAQAMVRQNAYDIRRLPHALQTDALWAQAVAWYEGTYFFLNELPWRLSHSPEFVRAVVGVRIQAIEAIPGQRVDQTLYAHAQALYGQHPDWPALVERHQLPWLQANDKDIGECWWRVFWTEVDVLECIESTESSYSLNPYEIPADVYTQAIADACYNTHGTTWIESVPAQFVPDARYQEWLSEGYSIDLIVLPLARRTAALCALAIEKGQSPQAVPADALLPTAQRLLGNAGWALGNKLAKKEEKLLARASAPAAQDPDADEIDGLDEAMGHADWVLLRAQAWLTQTAPLVDEAQADAQWLLQATAALGDEPSSEAPEAEWVARLWDLRRRAWFWLGFALWLKGEREQAQQLRVLSGMHTLPNYADFDPASLQASADLDHEAFGGLMAETERAKDPAQAWQAALQAQALLEAAGSPDPFKWAHVLDKKRWASLELGDLEGNRQACADMVQRLAGLQLWPFVSSDQDVGHMLGAAHHRLGARVLDDADARQPDEASLHEALLQHERARALFSSDEAAGEGMTGYWDSRLRILQRLVQADAAHATHWQARLGRELARVRDLDSEDWYWSDEGAVLLAGES